MWSGFESVIEHWAHFHMKAGRCFSAPCCSRTPIEKLPETCHRRMFQSLSSTVQHPIEAHREEVRDQQQKWVSDKKKAVANKKSPRSHQETMELLIDLKSEASVAQQMVIDYMERYAVKVHIASVVGRRKWFADASLGCVIVGHFLRDVDVTKQDWHTEDLAWLNLCRDDYAKWVAAVPGPPARAPTTAGKYRDAVMPRMRTSSEVATLPRIPQQLSRLSSLQSPLHYHHGRRSWCP